MKSRRSRPPKGVTYIELGPYPGYVGITFDPGAFKQELKRLGIKEPVPYVTGSAAATTNKFEHPVSGVTALVSLDLTAAKGKSIEQIYALFVHEAVHVKQFIFEHIGEDHPAVEQEAYFIQYIAQKFMYAYKDRKK